MHIEFLVEELSSEEALNNLVPKIIGGQNTFKIHPFNGKNDLINSLASRLRGYKSWLPQDWKIIVLVDEDRQDCITLKQELENKALSVSFGTKTQPKDHTYQVINRIVVEELEAWFFGDIQAVKSAFPRVDINLSQKAVYQDPDAIRGGTWEALERVLQNKGYYKAGLAKVEAARKISENMNPAINRSRSFQVFRDSLQEIINN